MRYIYLLLLFQSSLFSETSSRSQVIMGTFSTITLEQNHQDKIQKGFDLFKKIEKSLSSYDKNASVYQLNHQKILSPDNFLRELLVMSQKMHQKSEGYFDVTIGSVTKKLYHFGEKERIPSSKELENAKVDIKGIEEINGMLRLKKGVTLDFGGIGKGYAVDKVSDFFNEQNISKGRVALSGDIRCLDRCIFEIQSPFEENKTLMSFESKISNLAISTSGTYRRYIKEKTHHHLINPKTKKQGRAFVSVTILTHADNAKADAIATAVSVMPKEKALEFLKKEGVGFILVEPNGIISKGNIKGFVRLQRT